MGIQGQEFENTVYAVTEQKSAHLEKKKKKVSSDLVICAI